MRAVVRYRYGAPDVLRLAEVPKPAPGEGEVLVRIRAASANAGDWRILRAAPFLIRLGGYGLLTPKHSILGQDVAGQVTAVGAGVTQFRPGDDVFGESPDCGTFAEYACVPAARLAPKPGNLSFEQAAAVPMAGVTALRGLRLAGPLRTGQTVLVNGASGGVGMFAVQIAKALGAAVTGVCSTRNLELVRSIGADRVIDYTREDFTRDVQAYDLILNAAAYRSIFDCRRALRPGGTYVHIGGSTARMFEVLLLGPLAARGRNGNFRFLASETTTEDLVELTALLEAGKVVPVIDRRYPLSGVPDALRHVETGRARGKVVITVAA